MNTMQSETGVKDTKWTLHRPDWQYTRVLDADDSVVCTLDLEDWGVTEDNQEELEKRQLKVARLIASAPELLEAAMDFESWFNGFNAMDSTPSERATGRRGLIKLRAAIKAATGGNE